MNDYSQDNLISAYHDGELSATERAAVEHLLATSAEARAELESYRKLSNLLRTTDRPTLDADLAPLVMQTIEQRQLHPKTVVQPVGKSRTMAKWAAAVVTTAAAIVIAFSVLPGGKDVPVVAGNQNNNGVPETKPNANSNQIASTNTGAPEITPNQTPDKVTPEKTTPQVNPGPAIAAADLPLQVIEDLKKAKSGQIVRFMKNSGKDVAVFHLMVLDVQPGLESLQMILSAQQISGPMNQTSESGVVAVYVQANQNQLDKVIAELMKKEQEQFVALAVQPRPIKADAVNKLVNDKAMQVASSQVPLKQSELSKLGVNEVPEVAWNGGFGHLPPPSLASDGSDSSERKLLIVVEQAPEKLRTKTPQN